MRFEGSYHDMAYKISYIKDGRFGPYYDVQMFIKNKLKAHERASTLIEAVNKLIQRLRAWDLEDKEIIMTPEQAEKRIAEWKAAWALIQSLPENKHASKQAVEALNTIFYASMDLSAAGYRTNEDETDWYHPSEEN